MNLTSARRNLSGKVYDPVFLCMIGAMMLAIASSVALRAMIGGPTQARAAEVQLNTKRVPIQLTQPAPSENKTNEN